MGIEVVDYPRLNWESDTGVAIENQMCAELAIWVFIWALRGLRAIS